LVPDEYDFPAREEHNGQGRWTSPDPMRGTGNKYVYADNNPLSKVDIYGMYTVSIEGIDTSVDGTLDAVWVEGEDVEDESLPLECVVVAWLPI